MPVLPAGPGPAGGPTGGVPGVDEAGALTLSVPPEEAGSRIDRFLGRQLAPHYSRSFLSALVEEGRLTVDGTAVKPSFRLVAGQRIAGELGRPASGLPGPEPMELRVLHSDESLIVVDKPSGIVIHPGSGQASGTLVNGLLERFPEIAVVGRAERPGIVHRLDRETTGVIVVARTNEAAKSLVNQFKRKTVQKEYTAVVWGEMPFDNDWIDLALGPDPRRPQQRAVVAADAPGAQEASTFYTVEERLGRASLVTARPRTGRTHQIRVHLAHLGFPVIADPQYGKRMQAGWQQWKAARRELELPEPILQRHALHARRITLQHPATDEPVTFEAPLPDDMVDLIALLREEAGA